MDPIALTIGISNIFCGALIVLLSLPLLRGTVKPNHVHGVRFSQAFASDEAWYDINRYGAKRLIIWSVPVIVLGFVGLFLPLGSSLVATLSLAGAPLIVIIPALGSWQYARTFSTKNSDNGK